MRILRYAILIFKRNHVAAASQQKQVLVRITGILQALLTYEKRVELLMELMSYLVSIENVKRGRYTAVYCKSRHRPRPLLGRLYHESLAYYSLAKLANSVICQLL